MFERLVPFQAGKSPDATAIVLPGEVLSYRLLRHASERAAAALADRIRPGQRVLLQVDNLGLHWVLTLAIEALGGVTTALPGIRASDATVRYLRTDHFISEGPLDFETEATHLQVGQDWLQAVKTETRSAPRRPRAPGDPARIVVTSGTTGTNRKIMLTRQMLDRRVGHAILSQVFAGPQPRVLSEIGPGSIAGVMMGLAAFSVGGAVCQRDPRVSWAEVLTTSRVDAVVLAPIHLQMLLKLLPADFQPPPGLVAFIAGGSLSRPLAEEARWRLTPNIVLGYGATETGSVTQGHIDLLEGAEDAAGFIQPWTEVEVVDAAGAAQPANVIGELRIRGEEVVEGYLDELGDPDRASFRDGWFYPRDLGYVTPNGLLKVVGRLDDLLHLGGDKQLPSRIEGWALAVPGVADAAAFSLPDAQGLEAAWLAYVPAEGEPLDLAVLQQRLDAGLKRPVRIIEVPQIPRNALGKIMRRELRDSLAATAG